ncbi:MAG TPA: hypothetical protein PKJ24_07505 [Prolixibacteraceae bacterium]|nr:hypothetical protein [Prolixibacteraceae bacterium]
MSDLVWMFPLALYVIARFCGPVTVVSRSRLSYRKLSDRLRL